MWGRFICFWLFLLFAALFVLQLRALVQTVRNGSLPKDAWFYLKVLTGISFLLLLAAASVVFALGMMYGPGYLLKSWIMKKLMPASFLPKQLGAGKFGPGKLIPKLPFGG